MTTEKTTKECDPKSERSPRSVTFYVLLAAALFVFIRSFTLLSPILLSSLLILLISLATNPVISRLRGLTGPIRGFTLICA